MVVLCRAAGIPARVATGFAPGVASSDGFDLRSMDKHAWVEVYFPDYGWVTFDPTTDAATDSSATTTETHHVESWLQRLRTAVRHSPAVAVILTLIVLLVLYVAVTEIVDRRKARMIRNVEEAKTVLGRTYAPRGRALTRLGLGRDASETPHEYVARVTPILPDVERTLKVTLPAATLEAVTESFVSARYAGVEMVDIARLEPGVKVFLKNARTGWWRLTVKRLSRKGRGFSWT
jgi:hypothetical protein